MIGDNIPDYKLYQLTLYNKILKDGQIMTIGIKQETFDNKSKMIHFLKNNTMYYHRVKIVVFPYVDDDDNELVLFDCKNPYFKINMFPRTLVKQLVME